MLSEMDLIRLAVRNYLKDQEARRISQTHYDAMQALDKRLNNPELVKYGDYVLYLP